MMVCFVSASESHNRTNLNKSIGASLENVAEVAATAFAAGIPVRGAVATAFGCPFEGEVPIDSMLRIVDAYAALGVRHVSLGDTTGMATPRLVEERLAAIRSRFPDLEVALHFHNTRGIGLANVLAGLDLGIREFESSIGGIGGCPFAPGATGNICTEDLVYLLYECGFETGVDLERLIGVARRVENVVGHALPGQVMRAGPRLRRHSVESTRRAVG
jgi:hydroxymethylglutaryl-CoA lyase